MTVCGLLWFPVNFRMVSPISVKSAIAILVGTALNWRSCQQAFLVKFSVPLLCSQLLDFLLGLFFFKHFLS